jgi:hypothetical protein
MISGKFPTEYYVDMSSKVFRKSACAAQFNVEFTDPAGNLTKMSNCNFWTTEQVQTRVRLYERTERLRLSAPAACAIVWR